VGEPPRDRRRTDPPPVDPRAPTGPTDPAVSRTGTRDVVFDGDAVATSIHDRVLLAPGTVIEGPAVVEEFGSTIPIHPGFRAEVDARGNLMVRRQSREVR
jgi:N-methylhydantoinase A